MTYPVRSHQRFSSNLNEDRLGVYVTDFPDDNIIKSDKVIAFPHLGASTPEAEENCARMAAEQLDDFVKYGCIRNSVNFPAMEMTVVSDYRLVILNKNIINMVGQVTAVLAAINAIDGVVRVRVI